jgi:hypothetical protein
MRDAVLPQKAGQKDVVFMGFRHPDDTNYR